MTQEFHTISTSFQPVPWNRATSLGVSEEIKGDMPRCRCGRHCKCGLADALGRARDDRKMAQAQPAAWPKSMSSVQNPIVDVGWGYNQDGVVQYNLHVMLQHLCFASFFHVHDIPFFSVSPMPSWCDYLTDFSFAVKILAHDVSTNIYCMLFVHIRTILGLDFSSRASCTL